MNVMAYLLTLMNIYDFEDRGGPIQDISIKIANVVTISNYLSHEHIFTVNDFAANGYCRRHNVGRYVSKNVRDFIQYGNVPNNEEGVILTVFFTSDQPGRQNAFPDPQIRETLTYFIHRDNDPGLRDTVEGYLESKE